jgi:hypothetical protein
MGRMAELKPIVDEYTELEQVAQRRGVKPAAATATAAPSRSRGRSRRAARRTATRRVAGNGGGASAIKTTGRGRTGTPATSARRSERAEQILAMAAEQPGITVAEIAKKMGVDATGLYRPLRRLEKEGRWRKQGRELHVKA